VGLDIFLTAIFDDNYSNNFNFNNKSDTIKFSKIQIVAHQLMLCKHANLTDTFVQKHY
jgi:hypothetical protein